MSVTPVPLQHCKCQTEWESEKMQRKAAEKKSRESGEEAEIEMFCSLGAAAAWREAIDRWGGEGQTEGRAVSSLLISTDRLTA